MREKTSNQSYCVLHWQEAVLHGAMDCIVLSEEAVQAFGNVLV